MAKERDVTIDIMKGILILLVVMAHAQGPGHRVIYLFHMATFFMISGFLWKKNDNTTIMQVIKRKVTSLYIPYVVCNLCYLALFLIMPWLFEREMCKRTLPGIVYEVIKIFVFRGRTSMSDPTWYLAVLFFVSIAYEIIWKAANRLAKGEHAVYMFVTFSALIALTIGYFLYLRKINTFQVGTICSSYMAFHLGNIMRRFSDSRKQIDDRRGNSIIFIASGGGVLFLLYNVSDIEIRLIDNIIVNPLYYCAGMLAGWFIVRWASILLSKWERTKIFVSFIGRNSLIILCSHFAAFRFVAAVQCMLYKIPYKNSSSFPVLKTEGHWWIAYLIVGIAFPLLLRYITILLRRRALI